MKKYLGLFALLLLLVACAFPMKSFDQMSPTEKVTWMLNAYNNEYAAYQTALGYELVGTTWTKIRDVQLNDRQKEFYANKKALLKNVYPLIKAYASYVKSGSIPSQVLEEQITSQLDNLLMKQLE